MFTIIHIFRLSRNNNNFTGIEQCNIIIIFDDIIVDNLYQLQQ